MKRRDFSRSVVSTLLGTGVGWSSLASAQAGKLQAERDYRVLEKAAPVEAPAGKIEVVEFFGYYCGHCNAFEPTLEAWTKTLPKDVAFKRVPVAFQDNAVPLQRLFFSLEAMGLVASLHSKVFAAIHQQRIELGNAAAIANWIGQHTNASVGYLTEAANTVGAQYVGAQPLKNGLCRPPSSLVKTNTSPSNSV